MLMSDVNLSPTQIHHHNEGVKSLTVMFSLRFRNALSLDSSFCLLPFSSRIGKTCSRFISLLSTPFFPEFPSAGTIASCHLTHLMKRLENARRRYSREKAIEIRNAARASIGSNMPAISLELKHTLRLIANWIPKPQKLNLKSNDWRMKSHSPEFDHSRNRYCMGAMILAEIEISSRFDSPDKILAYAGASPSTYQSGRWNFLWPFMEKRGLRYLRFAPDQCHQIRSSNGMKLAYLQKKISEGKHYNVAITHAAKKLVRLIYAMEKIRQTLHKNGMDQLFLPPITLFRAPISDALFVAIFKV